MGITIHYRGSIADRDRIEEFEDRVLDMALEIGASAQVWRSTADHDPKRVVRGLLLDLSPGQETTSLLLSPEGCLVPMFDIEAAEQGALTEPPFCFVKTQYGSVEGHVALVELLAFLQQEFFPDLTVYDEAGYWESRDLPALIRKFSQMRTLIDAMNQGLQQSGLSAEAAEDPEILAIGIERIARQVHQTLRRAPEHPPLDLDDEPDGDEPNEAQWDALYKDRRRKQERLHDGQGEWDDEAADEAWRESLPDVAADDGQDGWDRDPHPLQQAASDLWLRLNKLFDGIGEPAAQQTRTLVHGLGEIVGGLAQALSPSLGDRLDRGLALVQLKRAWRGAAFAKGALVPLCAAGLLEVRDMEDMRAALAELTNGIVEEISRIRQPRGQDT